MGYLHIQNLYRDTRILLFREAFALEKVHGTSSHIRFASSPDDVKANSLTFFSGGEKHESFVKLFDQEKLRASFEALGHTEVVIYGEAYGGRCQGMKTTYGDQLRFIAFDVKIGESWLTVPDAAQIVESFGLEFVPYRKVSTDLDVLNAERDRPSEVAVRRGCGDRPREGVVLRPLIELTANNGERIIVKHKGAAFEERKTPQKVASPDKLVVLMEAKAIADEWCTEMRLSHVLDKLAANTPDCHLKPIPVSALQIEDTARVIKAMIEDIYREAKGEIVESKEAKAAIGAKTAKMFKDRLKEVLK